MAAVQQIETERVLLIPYDKTLINKIEVEDYSMFTDMGVTPAKGWPDEDVLDTFPRILINLEKVLFPTGFESWMIIVKEKKRMKLSVTSDSKVSQIRWEDKTAYEASLKQKRDAENTYSTAQCFGHDRGLKEGIAQGEHKKAIETALNLKEIEKLK